MAIFVAVHEIGRVERCDSTWVGTDFLIFNLVPLFPTGSWLHLPDGSRKSIPLHAVSVLAAYGRIGPVVLWLALLFLVRWPHWSLAFAACTALLAIAALAFLRLGKLSKDEKAKRRLVGEFVGAPVALAHIREELPEIRQSLEERWTKRLAEIGAHGYRDARREDARANEGIPGAAANDREALRFGFALARIDGALAKGAERRRFKARERALWRHLSELSSVSAARVESPGEPGDAEPLPEVTRPRAGA